MAPPTERDPATVDGEQDLAAQIGRRIRALRTEAGSSGRTLAAAAGVSQPFLSQLELGQTSASIATLYRIANALHTSPADLLPSPPPQEIELVRSPGLTTPLSEHLRAAKARAILRGGRSIAELYDFEIDPGDHVGEWFESTTEHVVYVLEGRIRVEFEDRADVVVETGDALFYPAALRHRWHLDADEAARVILVAVDS